MEKALGKYWQSSINARILGVSVRCRLGQINKVEKVRGQSCWGCNLGAFHWNEIPSMYVHPFKSASVCCACICVCVCVFTKTTVYLLAPHSLHNIMIMHCDSSSPGPSALSRDFSVENILADPSLPLLRRCLSVLIPLFCTKTAHNYCLSILHV